MGPHWAATNAWANRPACPWPGIWLISDEVSPSPACLRGVSSSPQAPPFLHPILCLSPARYAGFPVVFGLFSRAFWWRRVPSRPAPALSTKWAARVEGSGDIILSMGAGAQGVCETGWENSDSSIFTSSDCNTAQPLHPWAAGHRGVERTHDHVTDRNHGSFHSPLPINQVPQNMFYAHHYFKIIVYIS